jgi:hypothetical protein
MSDRPENIISFQNGTAFVVIFPFAPELTEPQKKKIDAARRVRFFVYGCSDTPMPSEALGLGSLEAYPVDSLRWAISRSTYITPEILDCRHLREAPKALIAVLINLAAHACSDEHRCAVLVLTERRFRGDDRALYRPSTAGNVNLEGPSAGP